MWLVSRGVFGAGEPNPRKGGEGGTNYRQFQDLYQLMKPVLSVLTLIKAFKAFQRFLPDAQAFFGKTQLMYTMYHEVGRMFLKLFKASYVVLRESFHYSRIHLWARNWGCMF